MRSIICFTLLVAWRLSVSLAEPQFQPYYFPVYEYPYHFGNQWQRWGLTSLFSAVLPKKTVTSPYIVTCTVSTSIQCIVPFGRRRRGVLFSDEVEDLHSLAPSPVDQIEETRIDSGLNRSPRKADPQLVAIEYQPQNELQSTLEDPSYEKNLLPFIVAPIPVVLANQARWGWKPHVTVFTVSTSSLKVACSSPSNFEQCPNNG